jgi:hypothetical protein
MPVAILALAALLYAMLPPPVPPDTQLAPPIAPPKQQTEEEKDKEKEKEQGEPDPAYMTLLPDDGSPWGLSSELSTRLAGVAERYVAYAVKFTSVETVRKADFDGGEAKKESSKRYGYLLERGDDQSIREYR